MDTATVEVTIAGVTVGVVATAVEAMMEATRVGTVVVRTETATRVGTVATRVGEVMVTEAGVVVVVTITMETVAGTTKDLLGEYMYTSVESSVCIRCLIRNLNCCCFYICNEQVIHRK